MAKRRGRSGALSAVVAAARRLLWRVSVHCGVVLGGQRQG